MKKITAIVLAAGKGTRMKESSPKALCTLGDRPLVFYAIDELKGLRRCIDQIIVVVGFKGNRVLREIKKEFKNVDFVYQDKLLGTAHAVQCAEKKAKNNNVLITCTDVPLLKKETINCFIKDFLVKKAACSLMTAHRADINDLGKIIRDKDNRIKAIVEKIDKNASVNSKEINSGVYCFKKDILFKNLKKIKRHKKKKEYFLTEMISILYNLKQPIAAYPIEDYSEIFGINTKKDVLAAEKVLRLRVCERLIDRGVRIIDPQNTFIGSGVKIGKNTTIYPFTFIENGVIIGSNCFLGPFLRVRRGSVIGDNIELGNFLEVNRTRVKKGTKIKHLGYLGDAIISENVNIGAGTVIANFDGKSKHKTYIAKDAFIGSDTVLVAPVKVGKKSKTGAGSVVTKNVGPRTVVVGVPAKVLKKGKL